MAIITDTTTGKKYILAEVITDQPKVVTTEESKLSKTSYPTYSQKQRSYTYYSSNSSTNCLESYTCEKTNNLCICLGILGFLSLAYGALYFGLYHLIPQVSDESSKYLKPSAITAFVLGALCCIAAMFSTIKRTR